MEYDIVQITQRISVGGSTITPGWPAFANWLSTQVVKRTITGYFPYHGGLTAWSDQWDGGNRRDYRTKKEFKAAVLSSEITGVLMAPPLSLSNQDAI